MPSTRCSDARPPDLLTGGKAVGGIKLKAGVPGSRSKGSGTPGGHSNTPIRAPEGGTRSTGLPQPKALGEPAAGTAQGAKTPGRAREPKRDNAERAAPRCALSPPRATAPAMPFNSVCPLAGACGREAEGRDSRRRAGSEPGRALRADRAAQSADSARAVFNEPMESVPPSSAAGRWRGAHIPSATACEDADGSERPESLHAHEASFGGAHPGRARGREARVEAHETQVRAGVGGTVPDCQSPHRAAENRVGVIPDAGGPGAAGGAARREASRARPESGCPVKVPPKTGDVQTPAARDKPEAARPRAEPKQGALAGEPIRMPHRAAPGAAEGTRRGEG